MLNKLDIRGFKCFDDESFHLSPLTLLSGLNSSGKSSFLQAIRLVHNNGMPLRGLGTLGGLVSKLHTDFEISLSFNKDNKTVKYPSECKSNCCLGHPFEMSYIGASRLGPELHLPICVDEERGKFLGDKCEYIFDFFEYFSDLAGLPEVLRRKESNSSAIHANVSAWLGLISPGIQFKTESIFKADIVRAEYNGYRPNNVGFGLSYTLPIIVVVLVYAALISNKEIESGVILLENPEAHLHPAGQTQLGIFIARAASCGVQIIVETHSDHLLNGIRIGVKDQLISSSQTSFYFFKYDFDAEKTICQHPIVDSLGYFDSWPDNFFDETEKNLERLL